MTPQLKTWLEENAERVPSKFSEGYQWVTKARGDYLTLEGMEDKLEFLMELGITDHVASTWEPGKPVNIGFNSEEQKWYGWSHRAVYGFGVGSECKKGQCHYQPANKEDFAETSLEFWHHEEYHEKTWVDIGEDKVQVNWLYNDTVPNKKLRGTLGSHEFDFPETFGRGEWTAQTLDDAKQMAMDFAEGVA